MLKPQNVPTWVRKVYRFFDSFIILWGLLSYTYAFNKTEVIVRIFTFVNFYLTYIIISAFIKNISFKEISSFFTLILIAQVSFSLYALDVSTTIRAYDFDLNSQIIGIFPNRNITAAIYLIQLPFLIYFTLKFRPRMGIPKTGVPFSPNEGTNVRTPVRRR